MMVGTSLARRLSASLHSPSSTKALDGDLPSRTDQDGAVLVDAAVLIAITDRPDPGVILTVRREHLRTHGGQIAFPGGRLDPGEDAISAALREAKEELSMDPAAVEVITNFEPYATVTGYRITPVIGVIPPDMPLEAHESEVADWFEAPLHFLLDQANHKQVSALFQGQTRQYHEILWCERRIWGATAAMIVNFSRRLQWN